MNIVLSWLAVAGAAMLLVAVAVAWFEHRRRMESRRDDSAWFATEIYSGHLVGSLDLDLSLHSPSGPPESGPGPDAAAPEQTARQSLQVTALNRMARQRAEPDQRNAWADTQPFTSTAPTGLAKASVGSAVE